MPVYLFTYQAYGHADGHAYGSRKPARDRARFGRGEKVLPANVSLATWRRQQWQQQDVRFTGDHQRRLIDVVIDTQHRQAFRCFGVAAGGTSLHVLVAWDDDRQPSAMRGRIKSALTRGMNKEFGRRPWLADNRLSDGGLSDGGLSDEASSDEASSDGGLSQGPSGNGPPSSGGGCKRVRNRAHFNHLVDRYLVERRGLVWTYRAGSTGPRVG
ncbi:MAG: hypothetical protein AAGG46_12885, partial [Planctomycetota bacterium]